MMPGVAGDGMLDQQIRRAKANGFDMVCFHFQKRRRIHLLFNKPEKKWRNIVDKEVFRSTLIQLLCEIFGSVALEVSEKVNR